MQDRVMDRSAAHATPPLLAVRDWLLVALAFSAGIYDAISFVSLGRVFTAAQTGNFALLGLGVAGTRPPTGPLPVTAVISLAAFAVGGGLAIPILKSFNGDEEIKDSGVFQAWPRRVLIVLEVALVAQAGFPAVWMMNPLSIDIVRIPVALAAFAMGLQINAVRFLHVPGVSTTAVTATFIALGSAIATWSLDALAARRLAGSS
jgi:uncharacterized membrane protein YoaK (UPF0700 family)